MNFRNIGKILLAGLFTALPMLLTLYLIIWLGQAAEGVVGGTLKVFIPDEWYIPGSGLLTGLVLIFIVGMMTKSLLMQRAFDYGEKFFYQIPVIKSIYGSLKDLTEFFSRPGEEDFRSVVLVDVELAGQPARMMGFVTSNSVQHISAGDWEDEESLMVYLPMSYQIGGYTLTLPASAVTNIDISVEDAMRSILTAGVVRLKMDDATDNEAGTDTSRNRDDDSRQDKSRK